MKIIGLDLSLTHTGYIVLNDGIVDAFGTIIPKKLKGVERLSHIRRTILQLIFIHNKASKGSHLVALVLLFVLGTRRFVL